MGRCRNRLSHGNSLRVRKFEKGLAFYSTLRNSRFTSEGLDSRLPGQSLHQREDEGPNLATPSGLAAAGVRGVTSPTPSEQAGRALSLLSGLLHADHLDGEQFTRWMFEGTPKLIEWLRDQVDDNEEPDWVSATILDACEMLEGT